ncbi:hypothetical protein [Paraburkholderia atlantica]|uniref:hypothetical protein n=1 Tax=Paraburkholderia atlantica TaxID=2654982 RepID=UPI001D12F8D8|nr:hypothetical protein [Paraburkholderia atlantica]
MNIDMMTKTLKKIRVLGALLIAVGLNGCGGSDGGSVTDPTHASVGSSADDELTPYYVQSITWHTCGSDNFQIVNKDLLGPLSTRASCTTGKVPLDYDDASKGSVGIGVLRVIAGKPANRLVAYG